MKIEYRSIADMNDAIIRNLYKLPSDIDLVVGIPRSGMLPANLVALYINKPFTDIDSFIDGRIYSSGERGKFIETQSLKKVLLIDDSLNSGDSLNKAKQKLSKIISSNCYTFIYGAVYTIEENKKMLDFYCEITTSNRIFQWNFFHHRGYMPFAYFDIDGVLCPNPPQDDDGPIYLEYISNAPVLYKPSCEIDTLVSCRLEKYRHATENWLKKNGIKYKRLIMLDMPDKASRQKWGKHGIYKGLVYKDSNAPIFVESSLKEARDILKTSKKTVFCTETMAMLYYTESPLYIRLRGLYWRLRRLFRF